ncbi:glycosyltransferase family 15 protein [Cristinia sonorae]|uniref:Glycosyltransferase family 15 protein n=1 Tax=Cristinia sonorae TaxID=1940300 RepID=A0A8K0UX72_9AGAR|nr:glycosyltransferase family 15 protein [Cristinia sonorae]
MLVLKMNTTARYVCLVVAVIIGLHTILSFTHEDYGRVTSLSHIAAQLPWSGTTPGMEPVPDEYYVSPEPSSTAGNSTARQSATLLMLARNSDVENAVRSVRELEDKFNKKFNYPWTFLNEEEFSDEFKQRVSNVVSGPVSFGLIPHDHWFQPDSIDEAKATAAREKMQKDNIIYGGSVSYRNMCRFNSGVRAIVLIAVPHIPILQQFFYRHALLQQYKWYWRVEPDVHFHCDIDFDPFKYMEDNNKVYGFTITMYEYFATIPTLWDTVMKFARENPQYVSPNNAMGYISDNGGQSYNLCHFWSNFEIASMEFWRGEAYSKFFETLDATGGFYYERWGDAPVHSLGVALFADKNQIHFFDDIGYEHNPYTHCPRGAGKWEKGKCACNPDRSFDYDGYSCMKQWERIW